MAEWNPRLLTYTSWLVALATGLLGLSLVQEATTGLVTIGIAAAALVLATLVRVPVSSRDNRFTIGLAVAAAIPFVLSGPEGVSRVDLSGTLAAYSFGLTGVWVLRRALGEDHADLLPVMIRRVAGYYTYAAVYSSVRVGLFAPLDRGWEDLLPFSVAVVAWLAVEVVLRAVLVVGRRQLSRSYLARALLQDLNVFLGLVLTGALFGELYPAVGMWALPIALLPYAFAHSAFKRFQETKATYKQTIRALARIPEVSGLGVDGHADRTTELATSIAKEMGLGPWQVEGVEYAGLMHDIGRVSLNEPQVLRMGYTDDDIAQWSAEIIAESPYLEKVAGYVRHQYDPFRKPGEQEDPEISPVSRIIKVAARYDWKVHQDGRSPLEALEDLHAGAAYEYDPDVVASLRRLLQARGVLSPARV